MLNIDCIFNCLLDSFVCGTSGGQGGEEFKGVGRKVGRGGRGLKKLRVTE